MPGALAYTLMDQKRTWAHATGPQPSMDDRVIRPVRGRMLGGSSSLNGMVYVQGNPQDFDQWAAHRMRGRTLAPEMVPSADRALSMPMGPETGGRA